MCIRSLLTLLRTSGLSCCLWVSFGHILGHFRHEFCWAHSAIYWGAFDINSYLRLAEQLDRIGLVDPADDLEAAQAQIQISYYICICICLYVHIIFSILYSPDTNSEKPRTGFTVLSRCTRALTFKKYIYIYTYRYIYTYIYIFFFLIYIHIYIY